ncbi:MAG: Protein of unknown function precursor containing a C-terminal secretion signal [Bacteroidetes bacterium]|jgi:hypothetical protein|nr:Protein of unknown function precursor containing a C-terminal secretion signal [Bacteroidota bacterium]
MNKFLFAFLFLSGFAFSQEQCATMPAYYKHLNDASVKQTYAIAETKARQWLSNPVNKASLQNKNAIIKIPVVFHVVYKNATQNIHDSLLLSQINVLNECFRKQNANYSNTRPVFDTLGADIEIEFCLASTDPDGNPTTGIVRKSAPSNAQFDPLFGFDNMKKPSKGGDTAWANTSYLNIWVGDMSIFSITAVLGYATFPGGDPALDGVVIQWDYIGKYAKPSFLGRTTVHEVGHWLGMRHIWADDDNGSNPQTVYCDSTDFVDDTPNAGPKSSTDCNITKNTCSLEVAYWGGLDAPDMVENYMDYSSDACMTMFTKGQKARMYSFLNTDAARIAVKTSTAACASVVGLEKNSFLNENVTLYPVPANNELRIECRAKTGDLTISVLTADGRVILNEKAITGRLNVNTSTMAEGFYFVKIEGVEGSVTRKFMVLH